MKKWREILPSLFWVEISLYKKQINVPWNFYGLFLIKMKKGRKKIDLQRLSQLKEQSHFKLRSKIFLFMTKKYRSIKLIWFLSHFRASEWNINHFQNLKLCVNKVLIYRLIFSRALEDLFLISMMLLISFPFHIFSGKSYV
jgi:hypothetical protein